PAGLISKGPLLEDRIDSEGCKNAHPENLGVTNGWIVCGSEKQEPNEACVDRKRRQDADRTGAPVSIPRHFDTFNRGSHCAIPWVETIALIATLNLLFQLHPVARHRAHATRAQHHRNRPPGGGREIRTQKNRPTRRLSCSIVCP